MTRRQHQRAQLLPFPPPAPALRAGRLARLWAWPGHTFCTSDRSLQDVVHGRHGLLTGHLWATGVWDTHTHSPRLPHSRDARARMGSSVSTSAVSTPSPQGTGFTITHSPPWDG